MCGIVAMLDRGGAADPLSLWRAMEELSHRGPDDEGYVLAGPQHAAAFGGVVSPPALELPLINRAARTDGFPIGLANRRLAILDLSPGGHGPMGRTEGNVWLTYNGEVYNYRELRRELMDAGYEFRSESDTEVVLVAYSAWGTACFERFNGMFALAIWDGGRQRLVVARDRMGIKPLYAARIGDADVFASEPRALVSIGADSTVDETAATAYIAAGYADWSDRTFFRGVRQVGAGTFEVLSLDGGRRVHQYWSLDAGRRFGGPLADASAVFRETFVDSVRLQLRSDVPVGTCLSGGLDSSSVVAASSLGEVSRSAQHAFTATFPGTLADEAAYARAVTTAFGLHGHEVAPSGEGLAADLDALLLSQGEPFPSSSSYAQWKVMQLAREAGVTVLLDGQGGDELLAGYDAFHPFVIADHLRRMRLMAALHEVIHARSRTLATVGRVGAAFAPEFVRTRARARVRADAASLLAVDSTAWEALADLEGGRPTLGNIMDRALRQTTLPVLLRSEDRNSMAHSREARVPFLDHRLVELAFSLPTEFKIRGGTTKVVLRQALRDLLPTQVLERRDKLGFVTPEADWIRELRHQIEMPANGFLAKPSVDRVWARFDGGEDTLASLLWRVLCFERWRQLAAA